MCRFRTTILVAAVLSAATPASAQHVQPGQEIGGFLGDPQTELDRLEHVRVREGGWQTFGGESGFFTATFATMGLVAGWSAHGTPNLAVIGPTVLGLTLGGISLGAWGLGRLAERHDWDVAAGWGAAGIWPGAWAGWAIAGGLSILAAPDAPTGALLASAIAGAVGGGALGFLAFRGAARRRGAAGAEIAIFWLGFLVAEMAAIVALDDRTDRRADGVMLVTTGASAALLTLAIHPLLR